MGRSAGFMTRNGLRRTKKRAKKSTRQLVGAANGPHISQVRRGRQNANRAKNRELREH